MSILSVATAMIGMMTIMLAHSAVHAADSAGTADKAKPIELGAKPLIPKPGKTSPPAQASAPAQALPAEKASQPAQARAEAPNASQTPAGRPINDVKVIPGTAAPAKGAAADPLEERVRGLLQEKLGREGEVVIRVSPDTPLAKTEGPAVAKAKAAATKKDAADASNDNIPAQRDKPEAASALPAQGKELSDAAKAAKVSAGKLSDPTFAWDWDGQKGPQHWGRLDPAYATCSTGKMQSPPKIPEASVIESTGPSVPRLSGSLQSFRWARQGPLWTAHLAGGSSAEFRGETFALEAIQFRFPGEPYIGNEAPVGSLHLIHRLDGRFLILAIPLEVGIKAARNAVLATLMRRFPYNSSDPVTWDGQQVDAARLLSSGLRSAFLFSGSLSYPPCTESVIWLLSRQSLILPEDQILELSRLLGSGARPLQPLNNRSVLGVGLLRGN